VDFKDVTNDEIQAIEDRLNNRPRKILGYKTPMEVMMKHQNFQTSQPVTLDG
jgi:IS30 family transposase